MNKLHEAKNMAPKIRNAFLNGVGSKNGGGRGSGCRMGFGSSLRLIHGWNVGTGVGCGHGGYGEKGYGSGNGLGSNGGCVSGKNEQDLMFGEDCGL